MGVYRPGMNCNLSQSFLSTKSKSCKSKFVVISQILQVVFRHCAAGNDLKTILSLKLVCKLWNRVANGVLIDCALIPWVEGGRYFSRSRRFTTFMKLFPPNAGLPVNLVVYELTPAVIEFIKNYSYDISGISFRALQPSLGGESFSLPNLKHINLRYEYRFDSYGSIACQNAIILLRDVIKAALLKSCRVSLDIMSGEIPRSATHLPLQLTSLSCGFEMFQNLASVQRWPNLQKLKLFFRDAGENYSGQLLEKVKGTLRTLHLVAVDHTSHKILEIPLLPKLRDVKLSDIAVMGDRYLPEILPILQTVKVSEDQDLAIVITTLAQGGQAFRHVKSMTYSPDDNISVDELSRKMAALVQTFNNLTMLHWTGADITVFATIPIVFAHLEQLQILEIRTRSSIRNDVVHMLTGCPSDEIPYDETTWSTVLNGNERNTILNLKRTKKLSLLGLIVTVLKIMSGLI